MINKEVIRVLRKQYVVAMKTKTAPWLSTFVKLWVSLETVWKKYVKWSSYIKEFHRNKKFYEINNKVCSHTSFHCLKEKENIPPRAKLIIYTHWLLTSWLIRVICMSWGMMNPNLWDQDLLSFCTQERNLNLWNTKKKIYIGRYSDFV